MFGRRFSGSFFHSRCGFGSFYSGSRWGYFRGGIVNRRRGGGGIQGRSGDVIDDEQTCQREARDQGKTLQSHWAHIAVHGSLHLQGFDHDNDVDAQQMESRETELLETLGFGNPYVYDD